MFWFRGSVAEAINKSKNEKKVFIVFINGNDVISQKMNQMYESLSNKLSDMPLVAIKLEAESDNCKLFSQIYPVICIPCTYFIDFKGVAIEIIGGSLHNQNDLINKIETIIQIYNKSLPDSQNSSNSPIAEKTNIPSTSSETTSTETKVESVTNTEPKPDSSASSSVSNGSKIDSKVERANQLIEAIREKKAKEEEEKAKRDEIERRKELKEMQKAKRLREDKEAEEVIKEREREKKEAKIARERVLAQIAADREERKARLNVFNSEQKQSSDQQEIESIPGSSSSTTSVRERVHVKARIQFRLPDGSTKNNEFGANDTLDIVRQYLFSTISLRDFTLSTTFPRREFTANDFSQTLQQLSLSPSSVLLVIPNKGSNNSKAVTSPSLFWQLFTFIFSPFVMIWNFISRLFSSSDTTDPTDELIASLRRNMKKKPKKFYSKDGNVARIRDPTKDDSDSENNTWNGNSTQQM